MPSTIYISDFVYEMESILRKFDNKDLKLMISGGSILTILKNINFKNIKTTKWKIYFADERISQQESDLNFFDAEFLKSTDALIYPINTKICPEKAIEDYISILEPINVCFLGVGEDGHIASIFPNSKNITKKEMFIYVNDSPKPPKERISVSISYLNTVNSIYFFIPPKNEILKDVCCPDQSIQKELKDDYVIFLDSRIKNKN
ncbi:6-phosphogluconolactonase-like protein [Hamiltosporidium tvaerminnensis]|uniref:6-phosphogluconolactonase-like protein n=1 Tax=Hamiltosporidium tvaerminnensis TaxID=1176355 RepID=A0A4Q9LZR2_9MICR|nr:6-phosphogluconolactonase sol3 [Hamiltosporidium tvaerminnensis]TBU13300.1 6-phosphogluconolactonase-like protein [Hamiltosporidium tvaerminnensis]TBU13611.1 6-phosphogluconolactonase-like protein [Hamiltosporidium tvaerminnensis]